RAARHHRARDRARAVCTVGRQGAHRASHVESCGQTDQADHRPDLPVETSRRRASRHRGPRRHRQDVAGDLMALDQVSQRYLAGQTRGRLATVGPDGTPQNKPVGFTYNAELGTIDIAGFNMDTSAKYRNVGVNPNVAFVVDDAVSEGAAGMRFIEIRGQAERVSAEPPPAVGLSPHIIRIHPRRVISMNIDPDHPGLHTIDVGTMADEPKEIRPSLGSDDSAAQRAKQAMADLVEELQAGPSRLPAGPAPAPHPQARYRHARPGCPGRDLASDR